MRSVPSIVFWQYGPGSGGIIGVLLSIVPVILVFCSVHDVERMHGLSRRVPQVPIRQRGRKKRCVCFEKAHDNGTHREGSDQVRTSPLSEPTHRRERHVSYPLVQDSGSDVVRGGLFGHVVVSPCMLKTSWQSWRMLPRIPYRGRRRTGV